MLGTNNLDIKFPWQRESAQNLYVHFKTTQDAREEPQGLGHFEGLQRR